MSKHTQHQHKAAEQRRDAGKKRGEKETELALLQSYIFCTILACFPPEGLRGKILERKDGSKYMTQEREIQAKGTNIVNLWATV